MIIQSLKLILQETIYFSSSFFSLNTKKFSKGIWSSQNTSQTCSRSELVLDLWLQDIYTWLIFKKTLSQNLLQNLKYKKRRNIFRDAKVEVTHPWNNCVVFKSYKLTSGPFLISFKSRANVKQMIPHSKTELRKNRPRKHIGVTDL